MKRFSLKSKLAAGAAVVAVAVGATAAYALWSASGTGAGSAKATTAVAITGTASASPTANADFYPGAAAVAVTGTLSNTNHYPVSFTGWSGLTVSNVTGGGTCSTSDFTAGVDGTFASPLAVPAQSSTTAVTIPAAVSMNSGVTGTNCQGAVVTVTFTLAGGTQTT